jgi:hypothetical protein
MLYLKSLTCPVIRHHTCLETDGCPTRFLHASHTLARFLHATVRFLHATLRFLHAMLRFSPVTIRFLHATLRFLHAMIRFLHATLRFLHTTVHFSPVTLRFSHATLLARFFGVVIRIGICNKCYTFPWLHFSTMIMGGKTLYSLVVSFHF